MSNMYNQIIGLKASMRLLGEWKLKKREKTLVIDPSIAGPLGLIIQVSELKTHGVDRMYVFTLGNIVSVDMDQVLSRAWCSQSDTEKRCLSLFQ